MGLPGHRAGSGKRPAEGLIRGEPAALRAQVPRAFETQAGTATAPAASLAQYFRHRAAGGLNANSCRLGIYRLISCTLMNLTEAVA
jgi:hypothetical protein